MLKIKSRLALALSLGAAVVIAPAGQARITRIVIDSWILIHCLRGIKKSWHSAAAAYLGRVGKGKCG